MIGLSNACYSQCYHRGATDVSCIIVTRLNPVYLSNEMQSQFARFEPMLPASLIYSQIGLPGIATTNIAIFIYQITRDMGYIFDGHGT